MWKEVCTKCGIKRSISEIDNKGICDICKERAKSTKIDEKITKIQNVKRKKAARKASLKNNYKLSFEDYDSMLKIQNNVCLICSNPETAKDKNGIVKPLSVDHHHESGRIRGLLCSRCNIGIGMFRDDIQLLEYAITYLKNQ